MLSSQAFLENMGVRRQLLGTLAECLQDGIVQCHSEDATIGKSPVLPHMSCLAHRFLRGYSQNRSPRRKSHGTNGLASDRMC